MKRAAAVATVAGVFLLGAVVGALATHVVHLRRLLVEHRGPPEFGLVAEWLDRRLDLSREQAREIHGILERHHREMYELRREMMPQFDDRFAATVAQIEAVLTPEQRERFQRIHPPFGHLRHRHGEGPEPPHPGEAPPPP
jgi:Spy/CpxP family protein refolding chaperone